MKSSRTIYVLACCLLIGAGLLSRSPVLGLPPAIAKYAGSVIWGTMVYFAVASLMPTLALHRRATITAVIAITTEFSQLVHTGWLDAFRRTTLGVLLIGRFFSWWDIVCYLAGIVLALCLDWLVFQPQKRAVSSLRRAKGLSSSGDR